MIFFFLICSLLHFSFWTMHTRGTVLCAEISCFQGHFDDVQRAPKLPSAAPKETKELVCSPFYWCPGFGFSYYLFFKAMGPRCILLFHLCRMIKRARKALLKFMRSGHFQECIISQYTSLYILFDQAITVRVFFFGTIIKRFNRYDSIVIKYCRTNMLNRLALTLRPYHLMMNWKRRYV